MVSAEPAENCRAPPRGLRIIDDFGANSRKFKTATRLRLLEKPFVSVRMLTEMKTILVEDNEQVREFACDVLELSGYRVLTAATPRAALAIVERRSEAIDLLITDVIMPEMNGQELGHAIKVERPEMKILYMSGYTSNGVFHNQVVNDGAYFLQKPFTGDDLRAKLLEIFESAAWSRASAAASP